MEFSSHILPKEFLAQVIVGIQILLFVVWLGFLLVTASKKRATLSQIEECEDVEELKVFTLNKYSLAESEQITNANNPLSKAALFFDEFCEYKIKKPSPLYKHLKAIFNAGYAESQIQVDALLSNTSGRLTKSDSWLRSVLSLFIILGLLGTLLGLAESLSQLSTVSLGNAESSNESLKKGLEVLLSKLGGAFAPSVCGVLLTVVGMLIFAAYLRWSTYPVLQRLEYETLTNWYPTLVPTPSQRVYEKLRLTEQTARNVEKLVETVQANTGELAQNIQAANAALVPLNEAAHHIGSTCYELNGFAFSFAADLKEISAQFHTSVDTLKPLSSSLTHLYEKMTEESSQFQLTVKQTLDDSQEFRKQVKEEFDRQSGQTQKMLESLKLYESAYLKSRQTTDEKFTETLTAAETALLNLAQQNEVFVRGLIEAVGDPLREDLMRELGTISAKSNEKLDEITISSSKKLGELSQDIKETLTTVSRSIDSVANRLETLETPIKGAAASIATTAINTTISMDATLTNFASSTQAWLTGLRQEFQTQNDHHESQSNNLASLNTNIGGLILEMKNLSEKLEGFATRPIARTRLDGDGHFSQPKRKRLLSRLKFWS
jgi:biopolymer transport protein ExbB/TolQ/ABC-type transporter Mla subunit MlaD